MAALKPEFKEEQKFTQWWLWVLLILVYLSPFLANLKNIIEDGFRETFSNAIFNHIITLGLVIVLLLLLKLTTKVNARGIQVRYFPFITKEFQWKDIESAKVIKYKFGEILGWGLRFRTFYGTVYNVRGYYGVFIKLKNGKKYLIGTQKESELKKAVKKFNDCSG